jgi:hypothetical protein
VTASPDRDEDGIPDHIDNCPADANVSQLDTDGDGSGDVCDLATCGDGILTYDEVCESGNDAACPGACANCRCVVCGNLVADPKKKAQVNTKNDAGQLTAGFLIPLGGYTDAPVSVALSDGDSPVIARASLGALTPSGKPPFKKWIYKSKLKAGIAQVQLQNRGPKQPGVFKVAIKAKKWFATAAANQPAAATDLTLTIGTQCFRVPVTKKTP